jgi:hypothetical protein
VSDWPPREARLRAALWRGTKHLLRNEYLAASRAFRQACDVSGEDEREVVRGLFHLAVAGYKHQRGSRGGAERQLAHARRRLAAFSGSLDGVDRAALVEHVQRQGTTMQRMNVRP